MRSKTDIPYSAEISSITKSEMIAKEITNIDAVEWWMAGGLEMRYKSLTTLTTKICKEEKIKNILELAAGVLPRGITMSDDPTITYIETDLPEMIEEKQRVISHLGIHSRPNLLLHPLNVLDEKAMGDIVDLFPKGPICIINEGLLSYFSKEEKTRVAKNVIANIRLHGGVWITPDIAGSDRIQEIAKLYPEIESVLNDIFKLTKRDMRVNNFGTLEEMKKFYSDIGFSITEYSQKDLIPSTSIGRQLAPSDMSKKQLLDALINSYKIWVLR